jgi:hypothetical protein
VGGFISDSRAASLGISIQLSPPAFGAALKTTADALRWVHEDLQEGYHDAFEDAVRLLMAPLVPAGKAMQMAFKPRTVAP